MYIETIKIYIKIIYNNLVMLIEKKNKGFYNINLMNKGEIKYLKLQEAISIDFFF